MDFLEKYNKGYDFYKDKNYVEAREIFNSLYKQTGSFKALRMLVNIDISFFCFKDARNVVETEMYYNNINTLRLLGRIENPEYNYDACIQLDKKVIEISKDRRYNGVKTNSIYYNLVQNFINNGYFNEARTYLREMPTECRKEFLHDFYYILIDIVFENYEKALYRLEKIDKTDLLKPFYVLYDKASSIVNHNLGRKMTHFEVLSKKGMGFKHILYDNYSSYLQTLLKRQKIYINTLEKGSILKWRKDIDYLKIIEEVREKIEKINPQYYNFMSNYGVILDYPVGYNGEKEVNGVIVSTPIHSDRITTIHLADFSSEFDREGMSTDKSLRKRLNIK